MTGLHWSAALVGTPYCEFGRSLEGVDCLGVIILGHAMRGYTIPSYVGDYVSGAEAAEIHAIIGREATSPLWRQVNGTPRELDVLIFRRGRHDRHLALYLRPGAMLHVTAEMAQVQIDDPSDPGRAGRLTGIVRWHEVAP